MNDSSALAWLLPSLPIALSSLPDDVVFDVDVGVADVLDVDLVVGDDDVVVVAYDVVFDVRVADILELRVQLETKKVDVVFHSHDEFLCS